MWIPIINYCWATLEDGNSQNIHVASCTSRKDTSRCGLTVLLFTTEHRIISTNFAWTRVLQSHANHAHRVTHRTNHKMFVSVAWTGCLDSHIALQAHIAHGVGKLFWHTLNTAKYHVPCRSSLVSTMYETMPRNNVRVNTYDVIISVHCWIQIQILTLAYAYDDS